MSPKTIHRDATQANSHIPNDNTSESNSDSDPDTLAPDTLFKEPEGYYKPEKVPTTASYTLVDGRVVKLRLVGESPLWVRHFL